MNPQPDTKPHEPAPEQREPASPHLTAEEARQGRRGPGLLAWMLVALALAMVLWVGVEFWGEAIAPETSDQPGIAVPQEHQPQAPQ